MLWGIYTFPGSHELRTAPGNVTFGLPSRVVYCSFGENPKALMQILVVGNGMEHIKNSRNQRLWKGTGNE